MRFAPYAPRSNKYGAKRTEYNGVIFDSAKEAKIAQELDLQMHAQGPDRVDSWERQIRIPLFVNNRKVATYIRDFLVRYANGRKVLVEAKGLWTPEAKLKRRLFEACWLVDHPDIEYEIR